MFQTSPGVYTREFDTDTLTPTAAGAAVGAYAGEFKSGPINKPILVSDETTLGQIFGFPSKEDASSSATLSFLQAASFLKYSSALYVCRAAGVGNRNATDTGAEIDVISIDELGELTTTMADAYSIISRYPGADFNGLQVKVEYATYNGSTLKTQYDTSVGGDDENSIFATVFAHPPGTSTHAGLSSLHGDECHILIIDSLGKFSGTRGTILEKYSNVSIINGIKEDGLSIYYRDVLNRSSAYVFAGKLSGGSFTLPDMLLSDSGIAAAFGESPAGRQQSSSFTLVHGNSGDITLAGIEGALDALSDASDVVFDFLCAQDLPGDDPDAISDRASVNSKLIQIAEKETDLLAFIAPTAVGAASRLANSAADITDAIVDEFTGLASSSYATVVGNVGYVYNKYSDQYVWLSLATHAAGLCARATHRESPWTSPAGEENGSMYGVVKLLYSPSETYRDKLYANNINPVIAIPGVGSAVLYGDKTHLGKNSSFSRINVRRLFNVLKRTIKEYGRYQLFKFNDDFTRASFVARVEPYLRDVKAKRGITDFKVQCDSKNNTEQVIMSNSFVGTVRVKPNYVINFVELQFISTPAGIDFNETTLA